MDCGLRKLINKQTKEEKQGEKRVGEKIEKIQRNKKRKTHLLRHEENIRLKGGEKKNLKNKQKRKKKCSLRLNCH